MKIQGQSQEMLAAACELFLGKSENEIRKVAQETLEGHQRAIMGNMTVEVTCLLLFKLDFTVLRYVTLLFVGEKGLAASSNNRWSAYFIFDNPTVSEYMYHIMGFVGVFNFCIFLWFLTITGIN